MGAHEQTQTTLEHENTLEHAIDEVIKIAKECESKRLSKDLKNALDSLIKKSTHLKEQTQNIHDLVHDLEQQKAALCEKLGISEPGHVFNYEKTYPEGSLYGQAKKLVFHLDYERDLSNKKVAEWMMPADRWWIINQSLPVDPLHERFRNLRDGFLIGIAQRLIGKELYAQKNMTWDNINSESLKFDPEIEYSEDSVYGRIQQAYQHLGIPLTNENQESHNDSWPDVTYDPDIPYQEGLYSAIQSTHRTLVGDWQRENACSQVPNYEDFYEDFKENPQSVGLYGERLKFDQEIDRLKQNKKQVIECLGSEKDFNMDEEYSEGSLYDRTQNMIKFLGIEKKFSDYLRPNPPDEESFSIYEVAYNLQHFWKDVLGDGWPDKAVEFNDQQGLIPAIKALHLGEQRLRKLFTTCKEELEKTTELMGLKHLNNDIDAYIRDGGDHAPSFYYDDHYQKIEPKDTLYGALQECLKIFLGRESTCTIEEFKKQQNKHNQELNKPSRHVSLEDQKKGLFKLYQAKENELSGILSGLNYYREKEERDRQKSFFLIMFVCILVVGSGAFYFSFDQLTSAEVPAVDAVKNWENLLRYMLHRLPFLLLTLGVLRIFHKLIQGAINQYIQHGHESAAYASIVTLSKNIVEAEPWFKESINQESQEEKGESLGYSQKVSQVRDTMLYHYLKERAQSTGIHQDADLKSQKDVASIKDMTGLLAEFRKIMDTLIKKG